MTKENIEQIVKRIKRLENAVFGIVRDEKQEKNIIGLGTKINFSLNERAFVKRYAIGKSGAKKFTILLAYIAAGKIDKDIKLSEIKSRWNKMSAKNILGKFNMFFTSDAKNNGWVNSKKYGFYNLTEEWKNIL